MSSSEWKEYKIKDVCTKIGSGATPRGGASVYLTEGNIKLIRSQNVYNNYIEYNGLVFIDDNSAEKLKNVVVKENDVLLNITGDSVARCTIVPKKLLPARVNQHVCILRANKEYVDPFYLKSYLVNSKMQDEMLSLANNGGTRAALTKGMIENFKIILPNIKEQKAISKILWSLDKKIENNNKINKKLEQMAQAIFKQWFVDFEFPNEYGKPYKSSGGEMLESELGRIPKGWKNKELKETIKFNKGKKPKIITDKEFDNSKLYLTIDVLNRNSIQYAINDKVVLANKKDILMVMDGASSGSLYYGLDGIVGSTLSKLVINDEYINEDVLYYFLKLNEFNIKGHLTGSAIPHTDKEYVNRLIMCIPNDKQLLVRVTKIFSDIREKVIINNEENSRLIKLRDILLPKLMSGEIRVPLV